MVNSICKCTTPMIKYHTDRVGNTLMDVIFSMGDYYSYSYNDRYGSFCVKGDDGVERYFVRKNFLFYFSPVDELEEWEDISDSFIW